MKRTIQKKTVSQHNKAPAIKKTKKNKQTPEYNVTLRLTLYKKHRSISLKQVLYPSALAAASRLK